MIYSAEDLLPLTVSLAEAYTSKESSSISYEMAGNLMHAVLYCIREYRREHQAVAATEKLPDPKVLYEEGLKIVEQKVYKARAVYESLTEGFEDYGSVVYRDTILKGMPAFFIHYDMRFTPFDHILTLDYPLLCGNPSQEGIDMILEYLEGISVEADFLQAFQPRMVVRLLRRICAKPSDYMENICEAVLTAAVACVFAGRPVADLVTTQEDCSRMAVSLSGIDFDQLNGKVMAAVMKIAEHTPAAKKADYFKGAAADLTVRMKIGMENGSLSRVFYQRGDDLHF